MERSRRATALVALAWACSAGCGGGEERVDGIFTTAEWTIVESLSPLPEPPDDPTNAYDLDPRAATLGQMLFFETEISGPLGVGDDGMNGSVGPVGAEGLLGCVSCHDADDHFYDSRSRPGNVSIGTFWGKRNTPTVLNAVYYEWISWDGVRDSLWSQAAQSIEGSSGGDRLRVAHVMFEQYRDLYDELYEPDLDPALDPAHPDAARFPARARGDSPEWEAMASEDREIVNRILVNFGKSIAAYERLIVARETPFDRYVAGDLTAISPSAKRGLRLFVGRAACATCHAGPLLSDDDFHSVGIPQEGEHIPETDDGRFAAVERLLASSFNGAGRYSDDPEAGAARLEGLVADESLRGLFRTKGLRSCSQTPPYMHTGAFTTLREVVEHYNRGGVEEGFSGTIDPVLRPLNLSEREIDDLVAFLESLAGDHVAEELRRDTSR